MAQNKTGSGIPSATGDNAATKTDSTSAKAVVQKKQHQNQKSQEASPPAEKKQPPPTKTFEGIASGVNPMKGIVIADGNGNKAVQFRMFQKKPAGSAAEDKA
jgi:hypothetical protein